MNGKRRYRQSWKTARGALLSVLLFGALGIGGCEDPDLAVPDADDVEEAYVYQGGLSASMNGNVAEITIIQQASQLQRGGTLWAKVGPYVLLFSEETEDLFRTFPGLAGVRVTTTTSGGTEVARAFLPRDELNGITWKKARRIAALARRDGTKQPTRLEDLVEYGEEHTEFDYNPRFSRP